MTIKFKLEICKNIFTNPHYHAYMIDGDKKVEIEFKPRVHVKNSHNSYLALLLDYFNLSCKPFNGKVEYTLGNDYVESIYGESIYGDNISQIKLPSLCISCDDEKYGFPRNLNAKDINQYKKNTGNKTGEIKIKQLPFLIDEPQNDRFSAYFGNSNSMHLLANSSNILVEI